MLFSIIVPIYNVEKYLKECIDSILGQDYTDFELILVDDGSPDSCPEICDSYTGNDSRVTVIHKENGGASSARNAGIQKSQGTYLLFVDSDDYWFNRHVLSDLEKTIRKKPADIIQFGMYNMRNGVLYRGRWKNYDAYVDLDETQTLQRLVREDKLGVSAWSMCIKRELILSCHLLFKEGVKSEDTEWAIRLYLCAPTWSFLDEPLYVYRSGREGSVTNTIDYNHLFQYCEIIKDSISRIQTGKECLKNSLMSYMMLHVVTCIGLIQANKSLSKIQKQDLNNIIKPMVKAHLLRYQINKKVKIAGMVYRIFGYWSMSVALGLYVKYVKKG